MRCLNFASFRLRIKGLILATSGDMEKKIPFEKTVKEVDLPRYLKKWYVITGRTTFVEAGLHDSTETYAWNPEKKRIDVAFEGVKPNGKVRRIPQKAWVDDESTHAHWKVQLFWPLRADYLILALDPNYHWTAVGVPNQKYLWIMSDRPEMDEITKNDILQELVRIGYDTSNLMPVKQSHSERSQ